VPNKRAYEEGIPQNAKPVGKVTGDQFAPNQPQVHEYKKLPDGLGMYPSDFPVQTQYNGPNYMLDPWQRVFMFAWFVALLLLSIAWFAYGVFFMKTHVTEWPRMT
jgi:hypothetical protein